MPQRLTLPSSMPRPAPAVGTSSLHEPGALHFQTDRLPWQRSLRWTEPSRDRRLLGLGILLAVLITLLELVGFAVGMRSYHVHPPSSQVVQVILIEPEADLPPPPPEPEPPIVAHPSRIAIAPPKVRTTPPPPRPAEPSDAMNARIGTAGTAAPAPQLFNPDGSIRLGAGSAPSLPQAPKNPREAAKARWAEMQKRGENPLDCKRTRFAQVFTPDESLGDKVSRKYLKWIGLGDGEAIAHRVEQREQRAADGCDPAG